MSKARQRIETQRHLKDKAFKSGFKDGAAGLRFRWRRHPQLSSYRYGYKQGK